MLLNYVVLRALWKIDVYLISTLVNKKSLFITPVMYTGVLTVIMYTHYQTKFRMLWHMNPHAWHYVKCRLRVKSVNLNITALM